ASWCTAVGSSDDTNSAVYGTLAERWNGSSWAIQPTPNPSGVYGSRLSGVSCSSASGCTAVGGYVTSSGIEVTLAERWNGTIWAIQPTPNPTGAKSSQLAAVSCNSASACAGVGTYTNSSGTQVPLAERWNGTSWAIQMTPNLTSFQHSELSG